MTAVSWLQLPHAVDGSNLFHTVYGSDPYKGLLRTITEAHICFCSTNRDILSQVILSECLRDPDFYLCDSDHGGNPFFL